MEHLVTLDTAGLSDDALHVLNLALATDEGTELEKIKLVRSSLCIREPLSEVCLM